MKIRIATDQDERAWDSYALNHPQGVAYHQFAWGRAVKQAYRFEPVYFLAEKNLKICGIFPLVQMKIPILGKRLVSLPYCDLGGVLADDEAVKAALQQVAINFARTEQIKKLELRYAALPEEKTVTNKVRMVLSLPESSESLLAGLKAKLRSQVKKPIRDGLKAKVGGSELVSDFYRVFSENMRDLGSPVHSLDWIKAVVDNYADNVKIGLVFTPDCEPVAAGIILLHGDIVSIPWASSLRRFNHLNSNMLLYWSFLAFAADNGYHYFDFGRSTPGEGTYKFKQQWGACPEALAWVDLVSIQKFEADTQRSNFRILSELIWKKMPLVFCDQIGPRIRKYISL